jgi:LuxR family maltose regulon positive regulatory protein
MSLALIEKSQVPTPILTTKLHIPPTRLELVSRPRLVERLNEGLHHTPGLTLISAPRFGLVRC